ncbi:MAG: urea ABC transporter permease subunit UrtB [Akkermansiaceae bacterium]|nr:urea ABC transporter permease subunit UrtB [Akkermansiaceae bacterium]
MSRFAALFWLFAVTILSVVGSTVVRADESEARRLLTEVILYDGERQDVAVEALGEEGAEIIKVVVEAWRVGEVSTTTRAEGEELALLKTPEGWFNILTGDEEVPSGEVTINRPSRKLRKTLKQLVDLLDLSSSDPAERIAAVEKLGLRQKAEYVELLRERVTKQTDPKVQRAFEEALSISLLVNGTVEERLQAVKDLGELKSFPARDFIDVLVAENEAVIADDAAAEEDKEAAKDLLAAAVSAKEKIDSRQKAVEVAGTIFRGLSLGSVLLLVSYGLAITFGLMGVINMAHGEFIAIGGYTVYLVQGYFAQTFGEGTAAYEWYFAVALPAAFLVAAFFGVVLERGVIQFLYRRPLESLLATWGVSMIIQQLIRMKFGAANVAVSSPQWLSGSVEMGGVTMTNNRLFVIGFALFVIVATWLLLTKTNWGLHVRATMQNRQMASSLGVRSTRVNMMTFAFGSGLAGLAGAFLSQIGNVGPSMGQTYIVDSFMVVVVGGVGSLLGAALSSLGIGMIDQTLQPILGPVMGKISVLLGIILFLQFKPGGLFPSKSRSLDD